MKLETITHEPIYTDAPFPECHASTIALCGKTLVAAWFGGTKEKHPDVGIWLSHTTLGSKRAWSAPVRVAKIDETAHWNPVLFYGPDKVLHLWFKAGATIPHWKTWTITSRDSGKTWSAPRELIPGDDTGGRGPVKNKPILLTDGTLLAGASSEQGTWEAFFDRSADKGKTWQRTANLDRTALGEKHGIIQATLWESAPGKLHALLRSSCGYCPRTDSDDNGRTWKPVYDSKLPNNNSGIDLARLADGTLALAHNPVVGNWAARTPLRIALSFDNGLTWPSFVDIETEPKMEFSYPAIIPLGKNELAVTYTWKRKQIHFWHGKLV